ncbi:MAG: ATP-dependent DNA helicase [Candidatus Gracilibacteria bacterium]
MDNSTFEPEYKRLNKQQKEAVEAIYGPIMVVAGPGTGKTQIIGLRTANIILKAGINPENILITTFTEAGVIAIRKRLVKFLGNEGYKVGVSTIHSFSQDVIKTFPEKFIDFKAGTAIDDVDSLEIFKKITDKLIKNKLVENLTTEYDSYFYLRDIKSRISNLKQEGINTTQLKISINRQEEEYISELSEIKPTLKKYENTKIKQAKHISKLNELVIFFDEYNKYLRDKSLYDFNDMINFVLEKFEQDDDLKAHYAEKYQFIMIDEYQDTNNAQNKIIDLILSVGEDEPNIMVVGDDDQSIYRFQGANIENMLDFSTKYKNTNFIVLENNYRSNQQILDTASVLIENNKERLSNKISSINKKLTSSGDLKDSKNVPILFKANSKLEEQTYIINNIVELINKGTSLEEIAIIVRGNIEVEEWTNLLLQNGIEAESKLKTNILNSNYVKYIINYLKLINDPFASENDLLQILRSEITGLHQIDIFKINRNLYIKNYSKKFKIALMDFLGEFDIRDDSNEIKLNYPELIINFRDNLLKFGTKASDLSFVEFFGIFIEKTGILEYIETNGTFDDLEDIFTLFNKIKDWNIGDKNFNIEKLINKIELYKTYNYPIARQILKEKKEGVQVLTAHSSKGLEYNTVFIPGLYTGNWESKRIINRLKLPNKIAGEGLQDSNFEQIEEDRRLFFVAITRARNNLFLSYPAGNGTKPLLESQFIQELAGKYDEISIGIHNDEIKGVVENTMKNDLIKYTSLELDYIVKFLESYKLSPSDLNVFLDDPIQFLNRAVFKYPFIDNKFTIFGKVYHRTLELFFLKYKNEEVLPEKTYLISTFQILLQKEILTPEEYDKTLEKGIASLEGYYDLYSSNMEIPLVLEYSFRRKNLDFEGVPLTGTIDKIEKAGTTSVNTEKQEGQLAFFKDKVNLIDYKTGRTKSIGQIKGTDRYGNKKEGEGKYFRQLLFYKLLCDVDPEFNSKFEIGDLALDFVEGKDGKYKLVKVEYSNEEYEFFKTELIDARNKISDPIFWKNILNK